MNNCIHACVYHVLRMSDWKKKTEDKMARKSKKEKTKGEEQIKSKWKTTVLRNMRLGALKISFKKSIFTTSRVAWM